MYGITNEVKSKLNSIGVIPTLDMLRTYGTVDVPLHEQQVLYTMFEGAINSNHELYDSRRASIKIAKVILLIVDGGACEYVMRRFGCPISNVDGITYPLNDGWCVVILGEDSTESDLHHELIHVRQHQSGRFDTSGTRPKWDGVVVPYGMGEMDKEIYQAAPWEVEAFCVSGGATPEQTKAYKTMTKTKLIAISDLINI